MNTRALSWALVWAVEWATSKEWRLSRATLPGVLSVGLVILGSVATACGEQAVGPAIGAVQVSVTTSGVELDTNGYSVAVDAGVGHAIPVNGTMTFTGLSAGSHSVLLAALASNCGAVGAANPRSVEVVAGDTARVAFAVTCVATTGSLVVTVSTTGADLGSDAYSVSVDGAAGHALPANGAVTITGLRAGGHNISLSGVATNCTASPASPISVTITAAVSTRLDVVVTCVQTAPRTGRIAFISESGCGIDDVGNIVGTCLEDIYVVNADGSNPVRLSTTSGYYASPVWSPTGTQVASGGYIVNADGSNPYWLPGTPVWSPDGARIAFSNSGQIHVMNADGTNPAQLTSDGGITPAWSRDGARIAFSNSGQIYLLNADGTNVTPLTANSEVVDAWGPIWSPDGAKIAFHTYGQMYVMNADGTNLVRLFNPTASFVGEPIWSPDGTKLVFSYSSNQIYVVNVDGTNLIRLGTSEPSGFEEPAWSPDGTRIVLTTYLVWGYVYVVNADGSNLHKLAPAYRRATWSPDGTAIALGAAYGGGSFPTMSTMNPDGTGLARVCNCDPYALMSYDPAWRPLRPATQAAAVNRTRGH